MKKTKLLLALCLAGSMANAQTIIYKYAGTSGTHGFSGDGGFAVNAKISNFIIEQSVDEMAMDASGNLYFSDSKNNRVRRIDKNGYITTIAGGGTGGDGGQASAASLGGPSGLVIDGSGNLYISETEVATIRKVTTAGIISTVAGISGSFGFSGDGGQATAAQLNFPMGIDIDASGNLFIADNANFRVRRVTSAGVISTVAGNGTSGFINTTPATSGEIKGPYTVKAYSGDLYIADASNSVIRKVSGITGSGALSTFLAPTGGIGISIYSDGGGHLYFIGAGCCGGTIVEKVNISGAPSYTTVAGNGTSGSTGDGGAATAAELDGPAGLFVSAAGDVFISDNSNFTIRKVSANCPAIAGRNVVDEDTLCCGCATPGIQIGTPSVPNMNYSWSPSGAGNINGSNTIAQPTAVWCSLSTVKIYTVTVSGTGCTTYTSTAQVSTHFGGINCCRLTEGIDAQNQTTTAFGVYPNPATRQVTISLYDKAEYIRITDMQGRLVFETKDIDAQDFKVDISKYNKGIYFINAKMGDKIEKQKLVVE